LAIVGVEERIGEVAAYIERNHDIHNCSRVYCLSLWKTNDPSDFNDLTVDAKRICGVLRCANVPPTAEGLALALMMHVDDARFYLDGIMRSAHPIMRHVRKYGIPSEFSVITPELSRIRCKYCGELISELPCLICFPKKKSLHAKKVKKHKGLPDCGIPTEHLAGTDEKIAVMKERAAAGFSVFCKGDLPGIGYDGQRKRGIREIIHGY